MTVSDLGLIVRLRDNAGHVLAVDYSRDGETWQDAATRLYNRYYPHDERYPRRIVRELPFSGESFGSYRVVMGYELGTAGTYWDAPVSVLVEKRQARAPIYRRRPHRS